MASLLFMASYYSYLHVHDSREISGISRGISAFSPFLSLMYVNGLVLQCAQAAASTSGIRRLCKKTQSQEMVKVSCRNYYAWMRQLRNIKFISALLRSWMTFKAEDKSKRLTQKKELSKPRLGTFMERTILQQA